MSKKQKTIGNIGNYYGCLEVKKEDGKYFWSIENYDGHDWQEIPKSLYSELMKFQKSCNAKEGAGGEG